MGGFFRNPVKATKAFFGVKSPPRIDTNAPNPIANQLPPVNFVNIMDQVSGQNFSIIRNPNNGIDLRFNGGNRIALDAPIPIDNVNTNLPAIKPVKGKAMPELENAASVVLLTQALRELGETLNTMERTSPLLVAQHQDLLTSFRTAQQRELDKGFDFMQNGLDIKLAKQGLLNSSTAIGAQVALAREKADARLKADVDYNMFAQGLKQQSIENIQKEGELIATNAGIELGRFNSESANKLQVRGQDINAEVANQELEQRRAIAQSQLQLAGNDQEINAEFGRRGLQFQQGANLLQTGLNIFNNSNEQAIGARATDNQAIYQNNALKQQRFLNTPENPWKLAGQKIVAQTAGYALGGPMGAYAAGNTMEEAQQNSRRRLR